ncbi:hypothetical protein HZB01_02680 [Candidatus Woesearchaeota archaeon]|nr:hypothetical protein [Candidatus Woesearchaeota archaeon]
MLSDQERKDLLDQQKAQRDKVTKLRQELDVLDNQKEHWFSEKEKYRETLSTLAADAKQSRQSRDQFTQEVKVLKEKRSELNAQIAQKIVELKQRDQEKRDLEKKYNIRGNPGKLKEDIEKLEFKIETEPMSFEKEKGVMVKIKELKARYKETEELNTFYDRLYHLSREVSALRQKSDSVHKKIQSLAKESQSKHEVSLELRKELDAKAKQEQDAFSKFTEQKQKFHEVNAALKQELDVLHAIDVKLRHHHAEVHEHKKKQAEEEIKSKELEIEEKVRKRKKLTNEDLLIFQHNSKLM